MASKEALTLQLYGAGDSYLLLDVLPPELCDDIAFQNICKEVEFKEMLNKGGTVPRLISYQGSISSQGHKPIYRVPTDDIISTEPFTPTVLQIMHYIEIATQQKFNHCLVQLYRSGYDYINEHADKTLDIERGSKIVNMSLGAERQMRLFSKPDYKDIKETQVIRVPHNSLFVLGWDTNLKYLHAIKQDKRINSLKSHEELNFDGRRISFTFRLISTFQRPDGHVYGQGAYCKSEEELNDSLASGLYELIRKDNRVQSMDLLSAFSLENRSCRFNWGTSYGKGFDITQIKVVELSH